MTIPCTRPPLSDILPRIVLGGAGFSFQTHPDPASLPVRDIIKTAFDNGLRAIDTSPSYEPSEQLIGRALADTEISSQYSRSDYTLMTKVGRIGPDQYDYSPAWVRQSVTKSLERLQTSYLDVVFCHDIEAVTDDHVLMAVGELLEFVREGKVKYIGLSSYRIDILARRAALSRERYGRPIDVIQNWGQLTIQNSHLETEGLEAFKNAGVTCICNSSPLAIGLLRQGGVPQGRQGDFHPAPRGLRKRAQEVADYTDSQGQSLAPLALRYSLWRAYEASQGPSSVSTLIGVSTLPELIENITTAKGLFQGDLANPSLNRRQLEIDEPLVKRARDILSHWVNWSFISPDKGWSPELMKLIQEDQATMDR